MSQPKEVLVESLYRGVISAQRLEAIVKQERKEWDRQNNEAPAYKNLQVHGSVDGVKIGLRVFSSDGRKAGKVVGFEPSPTISVSLPLPDTGAVSADAGGSAADAGSSSAADATVAIAAAVAPLTTPGAFVVQWASKPAAARNTYDGATESFDLAALKDLTWHKPATASKAAKAAEGDWTKCVFESFFDDVRRCGQRREGGGESEAEEVWLWLQLTPPLVAAFEAMIRAANAVRINTGSRWDNKWTPPAQLTLLPATGEVELSMSGMRAVVPAPSLLHTPTLARGPPPLLTFSVSNLLSRTEEYWSDIHLSGHTGCHTVLGPRPDGRAKGLVGSFLRVCGPRASPASGGIADGASVVSDKSLTTLTHLYQPAAPLLRFYVWALQRRGLTIDLVQNVVRFLLLRKDDTLDGCGRRYTHGHGWEHTQKHTVVSRAKQRDAVEPEIVVALSPAQLSALKQCASLLGVGATHHRAAWLRMRLEVDEAGAPSLRLRLSVAYHHQHEREFPGQVSTASLTFRPSESFTAKAITRGPGRGERLGRPGAGRVFEASFNVSDGSGSASQAPKSPLVEALLNAPPKMRAELRVRPGALTLWLALPKGGHISADAPEGTEGIEEVD